MTQDDKATRYDELIKKAEVVSRELSRLKSANAGVNTTSENYNKMVSKLNGKMLFYEAEMKKLFL